MTSLSGLRITKPRLELLSTMGIESVEDLLCHYPYRYEFLLETDILTQKDEEYFQRVSVHMSDSDASLALYQLSDY